MSTQKYKQNEQIASLSCSVIYLIEMPKTCACDQ